MSGRQLVPCVECGRHVRAAETACPFCSATLSGSAPEHALPSARLTRAAIMAFGLTVAAGACGDSAATTNNGTVSQGSSSSSGNEGSNTTTADAGSTEPTPVTPETTADAGSSTQPGPGPGPIVTRYGAPALVSEV